MYPSASHLPRIPTLSNQYDICRAKEGIERHRMLTGDWREEAEMYHRKMLSDTRAKMGGPIDITKNLFRSIVNQLSVLYDEPPTLLHSDPAAAEILSSSVDNACLWQLMSEVQMNTVGIRECGLRIGVSEDGSPFYRVVLPYHMEAEGSEAKPDVPVKVWEYVPRVVDDQVVWACEYFDISDPTMPVYQLKVADSKRVIAEAVGEAYPYRWSTNEPFIPVTIYHAKRTGKMWDWQKGAELKEGALRVAVLWTFWGHVLRDASWPQRFMIDGELVGEVRDGVHSPYLDTDPASLMNIISRNPERTAVLSQFQAGGDPKLLGEAIRDYAADLAADFDITPGDIQRSNGDARSGYAISLTREGQRRAQRKYKPQFRMGDIETISKTAAMINRAEQARGNSSFRLPEMGWDLRYHGIPLSIEERRMLLEQIARQIEVSERLGQEPDPALLDRLKDVPLD